MHIVGLRCTITVIYPPTAVLSMSVHMHYILQLLLSYALSSQLHQFAHNFLSCKQQCRKTFDHDDWHSRDMASGVRL